MKPLNLLLLLAAWVSLLPGCDSPAPESASEDFQSQIEALLSQLTLEEKIDMIHANSSFTTGGVERLGIPELVMSDGPHGVRHEHGRDWVKDEGLRDSATYLPVGTALAATWNPDLGYEFGKVLGREARARNKDVILGPGLNIIRTPINGRNFEYMTEDPYLNATMVVGYIKGVQEQNVAACAKHYIANNLEFEREKVNVTMSDRALREIYLPAFKAAVQEGGALTVMAGYNKFRGDYCAHSEFLLTDLLKEELGFEGAVISDWNAVKASVPAVKGGTDIEMGTDLGMMGKGLEVNYDNFYMGDTLISLVEQGVIEESLIDDKVRRILWVMFQSKAIGGERGPGAFNTKEHQQTARKIADEAIVLLKNDGLLPLPTESTKKIAVIGANAARKHAGAGGSSQVKAFYEITPLEALQNREGLEVAFSPGYEVKKDGGPNQALIDAAVQAVQAVDAAIYVGGWIHGFSDEWNDNAYDAESLDKPSMYLPFGQDELIQALLRANPNTIIVLMGGGPVDMRAWQGSAKAIVQAWYPGMEGGNALADILFGQVNPSGKLPMTFPMKLEDSPAHALADMSTDDLEFDYTEDILVGYRYFDTYQVEPAFSFGHGLSYTTFEYSDLKVQKNGETVTASLRLTNSGARAGAEVVQVYVRDNEAAMQRPQKELKAFKKVFLEAGASETLTFELGKEAFSYYNDQEQQWVVEPGTFTIFIGGSSRAIRLEAPVNW